MKKPVAKPAARKPDPVAEALKYATGLDRQRRTAGRPLPAAAPVRTAPSPRVGPGPSTPVASTGLRSRKRQLKDVLGQL